MSFCIIFAYHKAWYKTYSPIYIILNENQTHVIIESKEPWKSNNSYNIHFTNKETEAKFS